MKISVKDVQGQQEAVLRVSPETNVLEVKEFVARGMGIPLAQQQIIFSGNALSDDGKKLADYAVTEGSVLYVLLKKPEPETTVLRDSTYRFLRQYYNESDSKKIVEHFMKRFNQSVTTLSLDDLERIATTFLQDEQKLLSM
ncbi:NEDD8 [Anabrus simplex]|uniref:NEDD8 n=1 Tax=Anabrus simplex TaxID=316456 RepID=UPI0034DDBC8F